MAQKEEFCQRPVFRGQFSGLSFWPELTTVAGKKALTMKDTISKIEERIRSAGTLKDENRAELLDLLGQLKSQIGDLSKTNQEQAQSIAGFAQVSAHEATREEKNPKSLKHSILGLESSVHDLEQSHPQLVGVVNRIATMLANMGI